jgi:hypothetical protein
MFCFFTKFYNNVLKIRRFANGHVGYKMKYHLALINAVYEINKHLNIHTARIKSANKWFTLTATITGWWVNIHRY